MKATSFNGGIQSACIIKLPNTINPGSTSDAIFCSTDLLPSLCHATGANLPKNTIDGKNVWSIITEKDDAKNPHAYYPISTVRQFEGVLSSDGRWKLHLPHSYAHLVKPGANGKAGSHETRKIALSLFDLKNDPGETTNVIEHHPEIADRLKRLAKGHQNKFYR